VIARVGVGLVLASLCTFIIALRPGQASGEPSSSRVQDHLGGMSEVRLEGDETHVKAGRKVRVRVANTGPTDIACGYEFVLGRFHKGGWINVPARPVFAPRVVVPAGATGSWQAIRIPRKAPLGLYRVTKWIEPIAGPRKSRTPIRFSFRVT
jgi:hypothetical protein